MNMKDLIAKLEGYYHDTELSVVRQWRDSTGGKCLGYLPIYVPRELIHCFGVLPVGIMGAGDSLEIVKGDAFYQSYICHIPRSTVELGLAGKLDLLEGMLFPAICDVIRNLSGMWKMMFPGKFVKYIDFPQNYNKKIGGNFYLHELRDLIAGLEVLSGRRFSPESLRASICLYNQNRAAINDLYALRSASPEKVPSFELYLLMRASNLLEVAAHTNLIREYLRLAEATPRSLRDNIRVVVTGVFCEQPPLGLIRSLEASGCYIVEDDWVLGARYLLVDVPEDGDPLVRLANGYLETPLHTASRYLDQGVKGRYLIDQVKRHRADGVIFAAPSFCDPALLEQPMLQQALVDGGIPFSAFKYSEYSGQFQNIKEQTGAFSDSIKLWGDK